MNTSMRNGLGLLLSRTRIMRIACLSALCLLVTVTTANAVPSPPSGVVNINWTLSVGTYFGDYTSILGPTGSGKSTIAQLMYSPDAVKDDIFSNGTGTVNDVVWDTVTITENGDLIREYGVFDTRNYTRGFTNGYVYALIFQDDNVQPGDWYLFGSMVALAEISGVMDPQSIEINSQEGVDSGQGDFIDGPYGAQVVEGMVLTVNGGSGGSRMYTNGAQAAIGANVPTGQAFVRWTGDTQYVNNVTYTNALVNMTTNVTLTATYQNLPGWYTLTVSNGSGSAAYTNGAQASITADAPAFAKTFDRWIGYTQSVASVTSATTTVTMPATSVVVTATYKDVLYTLAVTNGSGSGTTYTNQQQVAIAANDPATGQAFDRWTGDTTQLVGSVTSSSNTVIMPATNVSVTATYSNLYYTLTVSNGTGSGSYIYGDQVAITAAAPAFAKTFDRWTGDTQSVASVTSSTTTVTMPAQNASLSATYKDVLYTLTVNGGSGGGSYTNGTQVPIAVILPDGKIFDRWTGATQYVASVTSPNTTVTMTNQEITVTATYNNVYTLTVNGGDGSGSYTNGTRVAITATLPVGTFFDRWAGATQYVASVTSSVTTVTIPAQNISLTRIYRTAYYDLTVNGGTGSGSYTNGQRVKIAATVPKEMYFVDWNDGNTNASRIITMPDAPVTYTANLIDTQEPTVKITYPKKSQKILTNGTITICGTAADNGSLNGVMYQLYTGEWTNAVTDNGWENWTANYSPVSGLNTARVYSVDTQGNVSPTSTVVFTYLPGAVMQVQIRGPGTGTIKPNYNGQVLEIGKSYKMTAKASKKYSSVFSNWTYGVTGLIASAESKITFVMQSNLVLTANFNGSPWSPSDALADRAIDVPATAQTAIVVDGSAKDWATVPCSSFSYASVTQEVAVALDGKNIALLLTDCPFDTSDNVLVYFKLRLSYGDGDNRHSVDLWTSGSVLYGMVDGQAVAGLEAVLLNGVLEIKLPVKQAPSQVTIEEIGCGMDLGGGTLTELFKLTPPPVSTP